jgi:hypothetical protein
MTNESQPFVQWEDNGANDRHAEWDCQIAEAQREYDRTRAQRWDNSNESRYFNEIADTY